MDKIISKSKFKPKALQYFREIEQTGRAAIITDHGKPVLKIVPYNRPDDILKELRGSVLEYIDPTEPVGLKDWEVLK